MSVLGTPVLRPVAVPPATHAAAVADLVRRYRQVPAGTRVQLRKQTSNLFRFGAADDRTVRLDISGLTGVIKVDPIARTAEVQGMATYETIVAATLEYGLMPLVVPQLKTITLGGAVTGLGIESTSFRHGLPHESLLEFDVLTPSGEVVTVTPDGAHAQLFRGFPNSYGTLGYTLRLVIELQPVTAYVRLEHRRVETGNLAEEITKACGPDAPDFVDGTVFGPGEQYLTLGTFTDDPGPGISDYTGQKVFYKSLRERRTDVLTTHDYIWRWDTDWFWCSRAFGVQHPALRWAWPRRYRRSDVYRRIVAFDRQHEITSRIGEALGGRPQELVVQDVEIPVERLAEFLDVFHREVGIRPLWLCPLRLRDDRTWPLYPMEPHELYVNVGFWAQAPAKPGTSTGSYLPDGNNRLVEGLVAQLGGHKSLYSTVHYDEREFWERYNGPFYRELKQRYDPGGRLPDLYSKVTGSGRA